MNKTSDEIHSAVQNFYSAKAKNMAPEKPVPCCTLPEAPADTAGWIPQDILEGSLGCGDPVTPANLVPGEVVLDLGSGGGLDCFRSARLIAPGGRAIGVDMTPDMLAKARASAGRLGLENVEFRQGLLESLPVEDNSVDAVLSNCVINLSPDKPAVFKEVFRVLKPGGRISISDVVTRQPLPEVVQADGEAWSECVAGALTVHEYAQQLREAGFIHVGIQPRAKSDACCGDSQPEGPFSAIIKAQKPV
jgi:SAM-dependent methyltransferase